MDPLNPPQAAKLQTDLTNQVPNSTPVTIEPSVTSNVINEASTSKRSSTSLIFIVASVVIVLGMAGAIGFYLVSQATQSSSARMYREKPTLKSITTPKITPTPKNEQSEIDAIDTTFPESEISAIQKDLQGL